jgi:four helix bundle protein
MPFKFENLNVWKKALNFSSDIHVLTGTFPKEEMFILSTQIKRAADSVVLNIAEGSTGQTNAEFKRFLSYSIRSCIEVVACLHIGSKRNIISDSQFKNYYSQAEEIIIMLQALKKSIK